MAESGRAGRRRERPRRPAFLEHLGRAPLSQDDGARPPSDDATGASPPVAPSSNPTTAPDAAASAGPADAQTTSGTRSARADPIVVRADAVNRPVLDTRPPGAEMVTPAPVRRGSQQASASALWLLVALVIGLAVGAVAGTVAALLVLG